MHISHSSITISTGSNCNTYSGKCMYKTVLLINISLASFYCKFHFRNEFLSCANLARQEYKEYTSNGIQKVHITDLLCVHELLELNLQYEVERLSSGDLGVHSRGHVTNIATPKLYITCQWPVVGRSSVVLGKCTLTTQDAH